MIRALTLVAVAALAPCGNAQDPAFRELYERAESLRTTSTDAEEVRGAFAAVVAAFPGLPVDEQEAWRAHVGHAAYQAGSYDDAASHFTAAMEREGETDYLVEYRLLSWMQAAQPDRALRDAFARRDAQPEVVGRVVGGNDGRGVRVLHDAAARALREGDSDVALWHFGLLVQRTQGKDAVAIGNLALAQRFVGALDAAEAEYLRALKVAPTDPVLLNDFGLFLKGIGRIEDAIRVFRDSLSHEGDKRDGPAIGNLVDLQRHGHDVGIDDPVRALVPVLASLPDTAELTRRRCIDLILGR